MNSIFEQLWNGQIKPYERNGINDPEVMELSDLIEKNQRNLRNLLNEEQKKVLDKLFSCQDSYYYLLIVHGFRCGFSLATKMYAEVFGDNNL